MIKRVIAGHTGWVRSIAFEPGNEWFCTGSNDRQIKIWDTATGVLKLTLTGHIGAVRGLAVSARSPYLFSAGDDKQVKCWDLETNRVVRHYHGHLSGVFTAALHPTLDVLVTGGRDSVVRVWDIRTKAAIHVLGGHEGAVSSLLTAPVDPQIISGSFDSTVRTWDLAAGKVRTVLTHHKKAVRALVAHPREFAFVSGAGDALKKWSLPEGGFVHNFGGPGLGVVNALAMNADGVLVGGGDDGNVGFWDWHTGAKFGAAKSHPQPGSLDAEAGVYAAAFDGSGSRLVTVEADKSIKVWQEDAGATPETHPVDMEAWTEAFRAMRRRV